MLGWAHLWLEEGLKKKKGGEDREMASEDHPYKERGMYKLAV